MGSRRRHAPGTHRWRASHYRSQPRRDRFADDGVCVELMAGATAPTLNAASGSAAPFPEWLEVVAIRGGAGMAALAIGAIFLAATGHDPWQAYREMMIGSLGSSYAIEQTMIKAIPLMLTGLGVALAFTMGLWNIGAEGQLVAGALAARWLALTASPPALVMPPGLLLPGARRGAAC